VGGYERIAVVGVGLLGGSLALALRKKGCVAEIVGVGRSSRNLDESRRRGIIDKGFTDVCAGVKGADLVVLAAPVGSLIDIVAAAAPCLNEGALITDVGSVKGDLVGAIEDLVPEGSAFVGGHPIAGGDRSGAVSARADLFEDALCILTPSERTAPWALERVRELWRTAGARVETLDPYEHDRIYGAVSHLPHIAAYALVETVLGRGPELGPYCGQGFYDTTRIAASSPEVWLDIFKANRENLVTLLRDYESSLSRFKSALEQKRWDALGEILLNAGAARRRLNGSTGNRGIAPGAPKRTG